MTAKSLVGLALAVLVALVVTPAASAQSFTIASTAPVAQAGPSGQTPVAASGQQSASTLPSKVSRNSGDWDPQAPPPPPPPAPQARTAGEAPQAVPKVQMPMVQMPKGQLVNVKVEFTITDQLGAKPPTKKTMTLTVADRESGRIRTNTESAVPRGSNWTNSMAPLSVDVMPTIDGGKIRLEFSLEYKLYAEKDAGLPTDAPGPKTDVSERLSAILDSGVPLVIAQSSDAVTDRRLTVEVKATIVK
jgi:hypothetical protein